MVRLSVALIAQLLLLFVVAIESRDVQCLWVVQPSEKPRDVMSALNCDPIDMRIVYPELNFNEEPDWKTIKVPCVNHLKAPAEWVAASAHTYYLRLNGYKAPKYHWWEPDRSSPASTVPTPVITPSKK